MNLLRQPILKKWYAFWNLRWHEILSFFREGSKILMKFLLEIQPRPQISVLVSPFWAQLKATWELLHWRESHFAGTNSAWMETTKLGNFFGKKVFLRKSKKIQIKDFFSIKKSRKNSNGFLNWAQFGLKVELKGSDTKKLKSPKVKLGSNQIIKQGLPLAKHLI